MLKFIYTLLVFGAVFLLLDCNGRPKRVGVLPNIDTGDQIPSASTSLNVDIFLDATLSMKGFIVSGVSSNYEQMLQLLERAAQKGWDNVQVNFHKFGTRIEPVPNRGYLEGAKPDFYTNPDLFQKTYIDKVVDSANTDNLTVVVSDLFQDAADVSLLTTKLKEKYLAKNLAVGILGIKSQFDGMVYDVGIRNYSFRYSRADSQTEQFRPFYVLLLGKHKDIERYYETLKASGMDSFPINFLIFSRYLGDPPASFENGKIASTEKIVEFNDLLAPELKDKRIKRIKQFRLRGNSEAAAFVAVFKNSPLPYTIPFASGAVETEVIAWKFQSDQLVESEAAKQTFLINGSKLLDKDLEVGVKIMASTLPGSGIYCFKVVMRPKEYLIPMWISEWDMPINSIEQWKQDPTKFNGATTFNLKPFMYDLWQTVVQLHKPKIGEFYCYIQKK